ncbi:hypothetical protein O3Q51_14565 [Cryomorphaceae bacterium 1068]|nr:hypothetical protein [Cryomorphaceae bacterium 1068]
MSKPPKNFRRSLSALLVLMAVALILDFVLPGRVITSEIVKVERERQHYYNAGGNHHFSYKVVTSEHQFNVEEDFAKSLAQNDEKIEYSVSWIFKEINRYRLVSSQNSSFSSLRFVSGIVIPLLTLVSMFIAYRSKKDIGTLVFVLQALLVADLVFVLL